MAGGRRNPALCVGPLNDWFFEMPYGEQSTLLARCASSNPLASRLARNGLPLRQEVVDMLPRVFPAVCDVCLYVRVPDGRRKTLDSVHEALYSRTGRKLMAALARKLAHGNLSSGSVDLVSTCRSAECRSPFMHHSNSTAYLATTKWTRDTLSSIGPKLLAHVAEDSQREAIVELRRLGLGREHAAILADMLRCARCRTVRGLAGGSNRNAHLAQMGGVSVSSTFFKWIVRLHHQLRDRKAIAGAEIDLPGAETAVHHIATWKCDEPNATQLRKRPKGARCTAYSSPRS